MDTTSPSKRKSLLGCLGLAVAIPVLSLVVLMAVSSWVNRPMEFDSALWKQNPDSMIRKRMHISALQAIEPGMTKAEVEDLLGPPKPVERRDNAWSYRTREGSMWVSSKWISIGFDEHGRVLAVGTDIDT